MKLYLAFAFATALSVSALAQQTPQSIADTELPSLITIYKDLHTHPELSGHEERSSAIVAKELKSAGFEVTDHVGKYEKPTWTGFGVIGVMKNGDGPVVAVRTDLDALPVHEEEDRLTIADAAQPLPVPAVPAQRGHVGDHVRPG